MRIGAAADFDRQKKLESWIARQALFSADMMEQAISATHLVRTRDKFGQMVRPKRGSVLASTEIADWDPEPDYFFHWIRDSAIVMRTVADLYGDASNKDQRKRWSGHFRDFVRFSLGLVDLGSEPNHRLSFDRTATARGFRRFLRSDRDLATLVYDRLHGEPRFNPDGTIDIFRWSRPQFDGPALRALACLRYLARGGRLTKDLDRLLQSDIGFTLRHADKRCIGPWEEPGQLAHHYYVSLVQLGALVQGRAYLTADAWDRAVGKLRRGLDRHWSQDMQIYAATRTHAKTAGDALFDTAALVAVMDADLPGGRHSVFDDRVHATLAALERIFAEQLPINRSHPPGSGPALGRYVGDKYFGGGAWYPTTLAAAAIHYRLALQPDQDRKACIRRGDAFMSTLRNFTPDDGALSEQFDRTTGAQTSARHLTWSYAAFIGTARLRKLAANR